MQWNPDPTDNMALNENHEANIGGKWVPCTPTRRRPAIMSVINEEEPMPLRGYGGERLHPRRTTGSWSTYTRTRSGMVAAWFHAINEANPQLDRLLLFMMTGLYVPATGTDGDRNRTPPRPKAGASAAPAPAPAGRGTDAEA